MHAPLRKRGFTVDDSASPSSEWCAHSGEMVHGSRCLCQAAPCGRYPVGQQKVHEYEVRTPGLNDTLTVGGPTP